MRFHHLGVAVANLQKARQTYMALLSVSGQSSVTDPLQDADITMLYVENHPRLELIAPRSPASPVYAFLRRDVAAYHVCYEVEQLDETIRQWQANGCRILRAPMPAVLFDGRRVAFLLLPTRQVIELLEE